MELEFDTKNSSVSFEVVVAGLTVDAHRFTFELGDEFNIGCLRCFPRGHRFRQEKYLRVDQRRDAENVRINFVTAGSLSKDITVTITSPVQTISLVEALQHYCCQGDKAR